MAHAGLSVTQGEVDLYFWNYCIGLLDVANGLTTAFETFNSFEELPPTLNMLATGRLRNIAKHYGKYPGYTVIFTFAGRSFNLKRVDVPKG